MNEYLLSAIHRGLKKSECEILFACKDDCHLIQETNAFIANKTQGIEGCHTTKLVFFPFLKLANTSSKLQTEGEISLIMKYGSRILEILI